MAVALGLPYAVHAASPPPTRGKIFDVRQFGARGDGSGFDTAAIQKALDAAEAAGGGTVRVPAGTYPLQPIHLHAHTTLQLDEGATLRASEDLRDYAGNGHLLSLINAKRIADVAITGRGIIDGSGRRWWQHAGGSQDFGRHSDEKRPWLVHFAACQQVMIEGIALQNSPMFHLTFHNCDNVVVRNVSITSPPNSPNTDGIDPSDCRNVTISGCRIDTGDDDIALTSFKVDPAHPNAACSNITISGCTILHGHGISIGGVTTGGVSGVVVQHCTFEGTHYAFRIKAARGQGGVVQDIRVSDIQMHDVDPALDIMCYYPNPPAVDVPQPVTPDTPVYRHIHIENLTATCPREGAILIGLPESPITDLTLTNVHISSPFGFKVRDAQVTQN